MDTKESVKRALWHKATDPSVKKTTKTSKNDKEGNTEGCSFKENKQGGPTENEVDMGEKYAAEGTRQ